MLAFLQSQLNYLTLRSKNPSTTPELRAQLIQQVVDSARKQLQSYRVPLHEAAAMTALFLEDPVLTDEAKDICVSSVNAAAAGDQITVPVHHLQVQTMPGPEHYLSDGTWDCLVDPRVQIASKIHLLAAVMIALKMENPSNKKTVVVVHRPLDRSASIT